MMHSVFLTIALLLSPAPAVRGGDNFEDGLRFYREGKYKEALAAFAKAEAENKDAPTPQLLYNKALAAFASGDAHEAEASAEKAAASGDIEFVRVRDFLRGNIAFERCERIEKDADESMKAPPPPPVPQQGQQPQAPPDPAAEYTKAIGQAEIARDAWIASVKNSEGAPEGPAARRNVERAIIKIEDLKKKKDEAEKQKKEQQKQDKKDDKGDKKDQDKDKDKDKKDENKPESRPESNPSQDQQKDKPDDSKDENKQKQDQKQQPQPQDSQKLTSEQAQRMLDKLDDKEKQRQAIVKRAARVLRVLRDW